MRNGATIATQAIQATLGIAIVTIFAGRVYAAGNITISLEQPKTPTNQNTFTIAFTTLDTDTTQPITVKCFKKGPSDGSFSQFGSDIVLTPNGGNSGTCQTNAGVISASGTYQWYATATAGSGETATSLTESVDYNTNGPGDPHDYNKSKTDCTYTIHFRTADDSGKTVKVEIYRSDSKSFNTDSGTRVGTVSVGSSQSRDFSNTVPDCNKTYYYAIRSFDSAGNGSNVVGDSQTVTITTTIAPKPGANQGAIPVGNGQTQILGETANGKTAGDTLGEASPSSTPKTMSGEEQSAQSGQGGLPGLLGGNTKKWSLILGFVIVAAAIFYARRKT